MKKVILYSALLIGFSACGDKDKTPEPTPTPQSVRVSMKVNGTLVTIENTAGWVTQSASYGLAISSSNYDKTFLMRIRESELTIGSMRYMGGSNENMIQYTVKNSSGVAQSFSVGKNLHDSHGSFTLTKIDNVPNSTGKRFFGTFSGTLYSPTGNDSIVITEGQISE